MTPDRCLLVRVLLAPDKAIALSALDWDLLVRQGRRALLLAELARRLADRGLLEQVPLAPKQHLQSALRVIAQQTVALHHEVVCILRALQESGADAIFLKGAGYVVTGLPLARARSFSDVDILVPKSRLDDVETALRLSGWQGAKPDAYDQRYYRQWMHELPPMSHVRRGTTIDVHHTILPETGRLKVNTPALFEGRVAVPGAPGVYVLAPVDMLLHSATHLFHEGEFDHALRDLFDLDSLLRHFDATPDGDDFWRSLVPRAVKLGLARPLYYALRYATRLLDTPVPDAVIAAARAGQPPAIVRLLMDACYLRALQPVHASTDTPTSNWARSALYLRSHWIRMPIHLLAWHLGRKAFLRVFEKPEPPPPAPAAPPGG